MTTESLDTLGMKCPGPILEIALKASEMKKGDVLEVVGDAPTFENHVRKWCERVGKVFLSVKSEGYNKKRIQIWL
jgi:TusA-related sulfurtransferase